MTDVSATFATFPGPGGVVGRAAELSVLGHLVDDVVAGRGGAVLVEGEPGIGKSTVLRVAMSRAATLGCQVFWCTAQAVQERLPLAALVDGLDVDLDELVPAELVTAGLSAGADPRARNGQADARPRRPAVYGGADRAGPR